MFFYVIRIIIFTSLLANDKILKRVILKEEADMKRKIFIAVMIIFTIITSVNLFIALICGAPMDGDGIVKYVFCALGMSILLPACFTAFFLISLDLSDQLEKYEKIAEMEKKKRKEEDSEILVSIPIPALVNALAKEKNLTPEEKERLLSYLEDL